jgi:glucose/arabinose dehydrogenase
MALALVLLALPLRAAVPAGFSDAVWVGGVSSPSAMAFMADGRLLVCQQTGALRVIRNGSLLANPMISLNVVSSGERGLLGVAIDPQFASNSWIYLYYTTPSPAVHNRLSRFTVTGDTAGSETILLELNNLSSATNHNGGAIHFGPDGKLYVAVGDNANGSNAQTLNNLLGKILRLNKDGSIPTDNPFYGSATGANRAIWALGLRNPFTFAFKPGTSLMYINDVGAGSWEEINSGIAGSNYGWPATEGTTTNPAYRSPLYAYPHGSGNFSGCAITGGAFYNPATVRFPSTYVGRYFFADFCNGWINTYDPATGSVANFASGISSAVDLKVGADGALYYLARGSSSVNRISYSVAPVITQHPQNVSVASGGSATFTVAASGSPAPTFRWQRNGVDIPGATSSQYTLGNVSSADNGASFRAIASNSLGSATSNAAVLTVTGANSPPVATITAPAAGTTYAGGNVISYAGTGNDPEEGAVPASRFTWQVDFHHDSHVHPFIPATSGSTSGSFTIPTTGETSPNVFYRIRLTVRDAAGAVGTAQRDVVPRRSDVTLVSSPSGLGLLLDSQPVTAPTTFTGVVGVQRSIGAPTPQSLGGVSWAFDSWSDGGAATHTISTPSTNRTYTAVYRVAAGSVGSGSGLTGTYWDNRDFTGTSVTRTDRTVAFDWGTGSPVGGIAADTFSVRWSGEIQAQFSQTYTFHVRADDGVRLWVNNQLLVDKWIDQGPTEWSGSIALTAGSRYPIRLEYYENGGGAVAELRWSSTSTPKSLVPGSQLYPTAGGIITGRYYLLTAQCSGKCLDVSGASTADGANVIQWSRHEGDNQQWRIEDAGGGWYVLRARHSGKVLEVAGSSLARGANVQQWAGGGNPNQQWRIENMGSGWYKLTARHSGKCLDVNASSTADGANVQQWDDNGTAAQRWSLELVPEAPSAVAARWADGGDRWRAYVDRLMLIRAP